MEGQARPGPLSGHTVIEMAGLGPVPLTGLMLGDMGARVVRIERTGSAASFLPGPPERDFDRHAREILKVDLKRAEGRALVLRLIGSADVLIEGFRPGVMERLGLGADAALAANPRLVYGRMTGFGQDGPLASRAGHDLTYLAMSGVLHAIGEKGRRPIPPLNLVADYGGGAMFLIAGVLAALVERAMSGKGQVVDAAMVDGASMLAAPTFAFLGTGFWRDERGVNLLDTGAPFYDTYETADGGHMAVACLEPQFFAEFARLLPLEAGLADRQYDATLWPSMREVIAGRFRERTREQWTAAFEQSDACVAPVLTLKEAQVSSLAAARGAHVASGPFLRPAPAPRLSRTPASPERPTPGDVEDVLARFGLGPDEVKDLVSAGVVDA
ncbi:MAG: CaiB/BaiF CoA transferase family protein [Rhizobiaceae bacterium]